MTRINLNMDDDLLKKIDDYAKRLGVNRSATISMLCSEYLDQKQALITLNSIAQMQELTETVTK